jgi:hypothetical protein
MSMNPLPASRVLEQFFLDARCRLLDLAAILDRIGRGEGADEIGADPRLERIRKALQALLDLESGRAERIQQIFSLDYDANWKKPQPRY